MSRARGLDALSTADGPMTSDAGWCSVIPRIMALGLSAGLLISDHYRLERLIGEGGTGRVWAATNQRTGKPVALKFLRQPATPGSRRYERFLAEARVAIDHPHVVRIHDVGHLREDVPFLVMELLRGTTLRDEMRSAGRLAWEPTRRLMGQVLSALACAHASGVIHRDIKPENVFLSNDLDGARVAHILDFGASHHLSSANLVHGAVSGAFDVRGTLGYASPEQALGGEVDARSDLWSFGVMLYECLVGHRPFEGRTWGEYVEACRGEYNEFSIWRVADVPPWAIAFLRRLLSFDANLRPTRDQMLRFLSDLSGPPSCSFEIPLPNFSMNEEGTVPTTARNTTCSSDGQPAEAPRPPFEIVARAASGEHASEQGASPRAKSRWGAWSLARDISLVVMAISISISTLRSEPSVITPEVRSAALPQDSTPPLRPAFADLTDPALPATSAPTAAPISSPETDAAQFLTVRIEPPGVNVQIDGKFVMVKTNSIRLRRRSGHSYSIVIWNEDAERTCDVDASSSASASCVLRPKPPQPPNMAPPATAPAPPALPGVNSPSDLPSQTRTKFE